MSVGPAVIDRGRDESFFFENREIPFRPCFYSQAELKREQIVKENLVILKGKEVAGSLSMWGTHTNKNKTTNR